MAGRRVNKKTKRKKKRIGTMDLILLLVFICLVIFTVTMIRLSQDVGLLVSGSRSTARCRIPL